MADNEDQEPQDNLKDLRRAADEGKAARAENDSLKRELAMAKAGIDTDTKLGKMFARSYDGELDIEAIRAEAREVGAIEGPAPTPTETATPEEREQTDLRANLASGTVATGTPDEDPFAEALAAGKAARAQGRSFEESFIAGLGPVFGAAAAGDTRVTGQR